MSHKFMRENLSNEYGILDLQDRILEIMVYIDSLCDKHDIGYCLMGGSALGAKRHGGFIPWDDDMDIFMTPDDYERFRNVFWKYGDQEKYYLQELGPTKSMVKTAKLRMNGTTYIEELVKDWDMHHGTYVDIFILHVCPDNRLLQLRQWMWAKYLVLRGLSNRGYDRRTGLAGFALRVLSLFPKRSLVEKALREVYRYRNRATNYYCNFLGRAVFERGIYDKDWFEKAKYVPFEKVQLKVPGKLHEFLSKRFGDYMKVPSPEQIKWQQHAWKWDAHKDFREYVPNAKGFEDEDYLI